ncbi:MAG: lysophospholipid acyltransferase family protein [Anaerovibrio sp.]|uniref:lysophospholipid acyltransferase family protein n=1 Tax=Anaerovibrio sp. TaxID=1872532 RepID=UPI0025D3E72A|nr:lysophospholipid acyltransferase family protein [Anaerovibrio sp.]MCR5176179.1 lysophospholipid acyltransferase family protein [Anaerovibrio sp.]
MVYKLLMLMSWITCRMPYSFLMKAGKGLGILYYRFIKKQRNLAIKQMMESLKIERPEAERLIRESFINMGKNFMEVLYMPALNKKNFHKHIQIEHLERMQNALKEKHGVVVLTGHVGNWEWLSAAFTMNDLPVSAIAKQQPNMDYTNALNDLRATINVEIFSRGTSELLSAAKALKKGRILGFLADQDAGPGGAFIDFLGKTASTPMGAAVFARKFNSPIIPAFILRQPDGHHKVLVGEVLRYEDTGDADKDLFDLTYKMTKILEKVIIDNPTQWLWFQKRWNTPPEQQVHKHHTVKAEVQDNE